MTVGLRFRIENWLKDRRDQARGLCCAMPRSDLDINDGGYHFWRCVLRRGHRGPHRSGNYLWGHDGGSAYSPIDRPIMARRKPVRTRRQRREADRWHQRRDAERKREAA